MFPVHAVRKCARFRNFAGKCSRSRNHGLLSASISADKSLPTCPASGLLLRVRNAPHYSSFQNLLFIAKIFAVSCLSPCRNDYQPYEYYQQQLPQAHPPPPSLPPPTTLPPPPGPAQQAAPPPAVAFTRVTPRASAPAKTEVQRPSGWPDSLRRYTQRAFINAPSPEEKSRLQTYLKDLIKTAQDRGELWTNDWDSMALPDLTQPADTPRGSSISASTVVRPASPFRMNFR